MLFKKVGQGTGAKGQGGTPNLDSMLALGLIMINTYTGTVAHWGNGEGARCMVFAGTFGSNQRLRRPLYSGRRNSGRSETLFSRTRRSTDFSGALRARPNIHIGARGPAAQEGFGPRASGSLRAGASHGAALKPRRQVYLFAAEQCT